MKTEGFFRIGCGKDKQNGGRQMTENRNYGRTFFSSFRSIKEGGRI